MPRFPLRLPCLAALAAAAAAAGCSYTIDPLSQGIASRITPYKVEIVQGNFISREQVEMLKPGMGRQQVRDILGTPLVSSLFHADRWDYVFTLRRQGVAPQQRKLTVFFKGDVLERFEGDTMPTEAEFVTTLENRRREVKVPELQASEEKLRAFSGKNTTAPAPVNEPPRPATTYPPLEPTR